MGLLSGLKKLINGSPAKMPDDLNSPEEIKQKLDNLMTQHDKPEQPADQSTAPGQSPMPPAAADPMPEPPVPPAEPMPPVQIPTPESTPPAEPNPPFDQPNPPQVPPAPGQPL